MGKRSVVALIVVAVVLGAAQLVPVERTNPPVGVRLRAPADVQAILDRSCADCHTNETRWPWYSHVAPASWLVTRDVRVARLNLDFSYWEQLSLEEQRRLADAVVRQVTTGRMPYWAYRISRPKARLKASEVQRLREWFSSPEATPGPVADSLAPAGAGYRDWEEFE